MTWAAWTLFLLAAPSAEPPPPPSNAASDWDAGQGTPVPSEDAEIAANLELLEEMPNLEDLEIIQELGRR